MKNGTGVISFFMGLFFLLAGYKNQAQQNIVTIGTQQWMKENLNVSTFRNGEPVPEAKTAAEWTKACKEGTAAWCYYDNDPANSKKYGKLYNGYAYSDPRGLAPAGWHIPTNDEYTILIEYLGGIKQAGLKLLVPGQYGGTNKSGFTGVLAGLRFFEGDFAGIGEGTLLGTSTNEGKGRSFSMSINFLGELDRAAGSWTAGISIRCIKDANPITHKPKPPVKPGPVKTTPVAKKPVVPKPPTSIVTSQSQVKLASVKIGKQTWMLKNLNVATYRNGDPIPNITDNTAWSKLTTGAYCYYNNDSATYAATYGKLYNWYAVIDPRGLAPAGWHVPTIVEWSTIENFLGGEKVAGGAMKETGTTHWQTPNSGATNSSSFTALPAGNRNPDGTFTGVTEFGYWWSSTEDKTTFAFYPLLAYNEGSIYRTYNYKPSGFSVRCLMD